MSLKIANASGGPDVVPGARPVTSNPPFLKSVRRDKYNESIQHMIEMFGSRAAQALAPRVGAWNLDIVCYLLFGEPVSKRPILANLRVGLKFQSSKYSMYSSG